ncbi:MAG TPA: hypothetical protein VIM73_17345, partial [Polyangiaceae bacterium]
LLAVLVPGLAAAQGTVTDLPRLGMSPGEPQVRSAPPATPFGRPPSSSEQAVLDFHGYVLLPMRVSVLERENPEPGQSSTALHSPPVIPQDLRRFEYTGVVPEPWIQLNLSYGNSTISATTIIAARAVSNASGIFDPTKQLGLNDAFITANLSKVLNTPFEVKVGAFTGRYGAMGMYDAGRYGTPLIARTNALGVNSTLGVELGTATLVLEHGFGGTLGRCEIGWLPAAWNDYADCATGDADAPRGVGTTLINHLHAGLDLSKLVQVGAHYFSTWSQDEQATPNDIPDGSIRVLAADGRLMLGRGGHLYAGIARTELENASTVAGVIEILNARGGPELKREYLGPASGGDGALTTIGAQYDVSVARLLYGDYFTGRSPDILLSAFGVATSVESDAPAFDGVTKLKFGAEATYNIASWFGVSGRFDRVTRNTDDDESAFTILSPRILFHTGWQSRDEFAIQYSRFSYGENVTVRTGYPPTDDPEASPDQDVFTLSGTFWW